MWLLKLHIAFSILCFLTFMGFRMVLKEAIIQNGYHNKEDKRKKSFSMYLLFLCPITNVFLVFIVLIMGTTPKTKLDAWIKSRKEED